MSPDSQDLAEIAVESANTAKLFDVDPRIAMLSFPPKDPPSRRKPKSGRGAESSQGEKRFPRNRRRIPVRRSFRPGRRRQKAPDSVLQGDANVFIFPSLEAGNIGYKIAQRLGGFEAVGPILQGLNNR